MAKVTRGSGAPSEEYYKSIGQTQRKLRLAVEDDELFEKIKAKTGEGFGEIAARLLRAEWAKLSRKKT